MYPAVEIHLRIDHVRAAHRPGLAAFGYAFRLLYPGYQPAPLEAISAGGEHTCRDRGPTSADSSTSMIHLTFEGQGGGAELEEVNLSASLQEEQIGPLRFAAEQTGHGGEWVAEDALLPIAGDWQLRIEAGAASSSCSPRQSPSRSERSPKC